MLDFQSGIDDYLTGVTHIIRGIDLQDSAKRQRFVYDRFGWEYPEVVHWGHVQVPEFDVELSTSTIRRLIDNGTLNGWDDPRAPTLAALERRGIRGAAVVDAMVELGTSSNTVELSMSSIHSTNRALIDDEADRYFLVRDGERWPVADGPTVAEPPRHPEHESRGTRTVPVGDAVLLEPEDIPGPGGRVWLKGYGCVCREGDRLVFDGTNMELIREEGVPVVHWAPAGDTVPVTVRTPDGDVDAVAEPEFATAELGDVVQFERFGYARVDDRNPMVAYFAHE